VQATDPTDGTRDSSSGVAAPRSGRGFFLLRIIGGASIVAAFTLAVLSGVVFALDGSLTRVDVDGLASTETPDRSPAPVRPEDTGTDQTREAAPTTQPRSDVEPVTVLLLASDSREVLTPAERVELGTGMAWGERTEVVALVRLDAAADTLRTVHVPRDTVLTLCDGSAGRINAAFGIGERSGVGGITCVVQTLSAWSGVPIDHAVLADFRGFVDIVDAIGGIELYLDQPLYDRRANLDLQAGCQVLDGADALAFARARSIDNDFGRISRQQRLLIELRDQLTENGVLTEPVRTLRFAEAVASSLRIDASLTLNRIRQLAGDHRRTAQLPLDMRTIQGTPDTSGPAWLLRPDEAAAAELFTWLLEGDPEPPPRQPDPDDLGPQVPSNDTAGPGVDEPNDETEEPPVGSQPQRCP
jgi:LCP family protein required for cell wall assembly